MMNNLVQISVVVPVYNGEKYLQECIDSILEQTFNEFELILVDDGSKDNSCTICDENARLDVRIKVIHQANGGVVFARRSGLSVAKGEWICFVDSDDTIPPDSLSCLIDGSKKYDTDLVVGHYDRVSFSPPSQIPLAKWREYCCEGKHTNPWGKLIRRSLFSKWVLDIPKEIDKGEDLLMNIRLSFNMTKAPVEVHKKVYNYRRNSSSISHTKRSTLEYEVLFDTFRKQSIPEKDLPKYIKHFIRSRLNGLTGPANFNPELLCDKKHPYMQRLKNEIKACGYHMDFQEWMLLNIRWPWLYRAFSFVLKVKNYLRHRLKFII